MDPVRARPIGIRDCDKTIVGSVVDPTVTNAVGYKPPTTIV